MNSLYPMPIPRQITKLYRDPLDIIWLNAAHHAEMRIIRSSEVYAHWNGKGNLILADQASMDPDDCLAQMIFHEFCHALTEGKERFYLADWGLENIDDRDLDRERASLHVQAALASDYGLQYLLAPTTDHRAYYDHIVDDYFNRAIASFSAIEAAQNALADKSWKIRTITEHALKKTKALRDLIKDESDPETIWI